MPGIYLAALYSRKEEMRQVAERIHAETTCRVTSRWIWSEMDLSYSGQEKASIMDAENVAASDVLVLFTQAIGSMNPGGGRHSELGMAIAYGWSIVVCGPRETVFCYYPGIEVVDSVEELLRYLRETGDGRVRSASDKEGR